MTVNDQRNRFNAQVAPAFAAAVGVTTRWTGTASRRFAYFADENRFVIVAGPQEAEKVELALAWGLHYREHRRLVLVLPQDNSFATMQRAPWLAVDAQPEIWLHDGSAATQAPARTRADTRAALLSHIAVDPADELRKAATPLHLGQRSASLSALVEWVTTHPLLDPGHRQSERSWHCRGQRVLSIKPGKGGITITPGIHYSAADKAPAQTTLSAGGSLSPEQLNAIQAEVQGGIDARLEPGGAHHSSDEHWLQSVIRRDPKLLGIEQPALRELPAWRPRDASRTWGRGYLDLIGVDGHGDIRIVETKVAANQDDLLILQGLDYYIWAQTYRSALLTWLSAPDRAGFEIHYVIGDQAGSAHASRFAPAQVRSLAPDIRWRFQTVHNWFHGPARIGEAAAQLLPRDVIS